MAEATAPASSANLGSGFDTLALAFELRCVVEAEKADEWKVRHVGPEVPPPDGPDRVLAAARAATSGGRPLSLVVRNQIPVGMGLGASAAAAVAGYAATKKAMEEPLTADGAFRIASSLDGHGDNAAAASYGGLVAVTVGGRAMRLELHPSLEVVLAIPREPLPTETARGVLARHVEMGLAVRSISRVVALTEGLRRADPDLLRDALGDEIHEQPRRSLRPEIEGIMRVALEAGSLFACWSGAGPSVLAVTAGHGARKIVAQALSQELEAGGSVITPELAKRGLA